MKKLAYILLITLYASHVFSADVSNEKYNFSVLDLNQDGMLSEAEYNMSRIGLKENEILDRTTRITSNSVEFSAFELGKVNEIDDQQWLPDEWLDEN